MVGKMGGDQPRNIGPMLSSLRRGGEDAFGHAYRSPAVSGKSVAECMAARRNGTTRQLTYCFLRLANLDSGAFERLSRYEAALWRQTVQTLIALQPIRYR